MPEATPPTSSIAPLPDSLKSVFPSAPQPSPKSLPKISFGSLRKVPLRLLLSGAFLLLLIVGGAAAYFLSQNKQDIRQQASTGQDCEYMCSSIPGGASHDQCVASCAGTTNTVPVTQCETGFTAVSGSCVLTSSLSGTATPTKEDLNNDALTCPTGQHLLLGACVSDSDSDQTTTSVSVGTTGVGGSSGAGSTTSTTDPCKNLPPGPDHDGCVVANNAEKLGIEPADVPTACKGTESMCLNTARYICSGGEWVSSGTCSTTISTLCSDLTKVTCPAGQVPVCNNGQPDCSTSVVDGAKGNQLVVIADGNNQGQDSTTVTAQAVANAVTTAEKAAQSAKTTAEITADINKQLGAGSADKLYAGQIACGDYCSSCPNGTIGKGRAGTVYCNASSSLSPEAAAAIKDVIKVASNVVQTFAGTALQTASTLPQSNSASTQAPASNQSIAQKVADTSTAQKTAITQALKPVFASPSPALRCETGFTRTSLGCVKTSTLSGNQTNVVNEGDAITNSGEKVVNSNAELCPAGQAMVLGKCVATSLRDAYMDNLSNDACGGKGQPACNVHASVLQTTTACDPGYQFNSSSQSCESEYTSTPVSTLIAQTTPETSGRSTAQEGAAPRTPREQREIYNDCIANSPGDSSTGQATADSVAKCREASGITALEQSTYSVTHASELGYATSSIGDSKRETNFTYCPKAEGINYCQCTDGSIPQAGGSCQTDAGRIIQVNTYDVAAGKAASSRATEVVARPANALAIALFDGIARSSGSEYAKQLLDNTAAGKIDIGKTPIWLIPITPYLSACKDLGQGKGEVGCTVAIGGTGLAAGTAAAAGAAVIPAGITAAADSLLAGYVTTSTYITSAGVGVGGAIAKIALDNPALATNVQKITEFFGKVSAPVTTQLPILGNVSVAGTLQNLFNSAMTAASMSGGSAGKDIPIIGDLVASVPATGVPVVDQHNFAQGISGFFEGLVGGFFTGANVGYADAIKGESKVAKTKSIFPPAEPDIAPCPIGNPNLVPVSYYKNGEYKGQVAGSTAKNPCYTVYGVAGDQLFEADTTTDAKTPLDAVKTIDPNFEVIGGGSFGSVAKDSRNKTVFKSIYETTAADVKAMFDTTQEYDDAVKAFKQVFPGKTEKDFIEDAQRQMYEINSKQLQLMIKNNGNGALPKIISVVTEEVPPSVVYPDGQKIVGYQMEAIQGNSLKSVAAQQGNTITPGQKKAILDAYDNYVAKIDPTLLDGTTVTKAHGDVVLYESAKINGGNIMLQQKPGVDNWSARLIDPMVNKKLPGTGTVITPQVEKAMLSGLLDRITK